MIINNYGPESKNCVQTRTEGATVFSSNKPALAKLLIVDISTNVQSAKNPYMDKILVRKTSHHRGNDKLFNIFWHLGLEQERLYQHLHGYRTPFELEVNKRFFEPLETCQAILSILKNGFTTEWGPILPSP